MKYFKRTDGNYSQVNELTNPTDYKNYKEMYEEITEQEYLDKTKVVEVEYTPSYNELVNDKIRARYSLSEELAILRQKDSKVDEFVEYNNYCENCKQQARLELGIK